MKEMYRKYIMIYSLYNTSFGIEAVISHVHQYYSAWSGLKVNSVITWIIWGELKSFLAQRTYDQRFLNET